MTDDSHDRNHAGFWANPNRTILGMGYMGGSLFAFVAGAYGGTLELAAFAGWMAVTVLFYWSINLVLKRERAAVEAA